PEETAVTSVQDGEVVNEEVKSKEDIEETREDKKEEAAPVKEEPAQKEDLPVPEETTVVSVQDGEVVNEEVKSEETSEDKSEDKQETVPSNEEAAPIAISEPIVEEEAATAAEVSDVVQEVLPQEATAGETKAE